MAISTNPKPAIYRNLYENMDLWIGVDSTAETEFLYAGDQQ